MGNMSHCRFENTSHDMEDCIDNWELDKDEASDYEIKGKARIIELAKDIVEMEGFSIEED